MLEGTVTFSLDGLGLFGGVDVFRGGGIVSESEYALLEQQLLKQQNNRHKPAMRAQARLIQ